MKMNDPTSPVSDYAIAGVDTQMADSGLKKIISRVRQTWPQHTGVGAVQLEIGQYANIINIGDNKGICIATDGVGTKALIAQLVGKYDSIGIDCVAMNVNDIICVGARPLSLVDYIAVRKADPDLLDQLAIGLCKGAEYADISISGGEIAQLSDLLADHGTQHNFDLVGTAIGIIDLDKIIVGRDIQEGDVLIGIESNGVHSNGFTLARHVFFNKNNCTVESTFADLDMALGEELLRPTYIYVKEIQEMLNQKIPIKALVHITGDGFLNLARIANGIGFRIETLPEIPAIFALMQNLGKVTPEEMFTVFNMGIGFCIVVDNTYAQEVITTVKKHNKTAHILGHAVKDPKKRVFIEQHKLVGEDKIMKSI